MSAEFAEENQHHEVLAEPTGVPSEILDDPKRFDKQIPYLQRTVAFVRQYEASSVKGRKALLNQLASSIVNDPKIITHIFNNLELISQLKPNLDHIETQARLEENMVEIVTRRSELPTWTPGRIEELIKVGFESPTQVKQAIEKLKIALFNTPQTVEEAVDLYYNAVWAMVGTLHQDVREEIFSILCFEKPWLTPGSTSMICFETGMLSADDEHLGKYFACLDAMEEVGKLLEIDIVYKGLDADQPFFQSKRMDSREALYESFTAQANESDRALIKQMFASQSRRDSVRFNRLTQVILESKPHEAGRMTQYYMQEYDLPVWEAAMKYHSQILKQPWPHNVLKNPNEPLRKLLLEYFSKRIFRALWEAEKNDLLSTGYQSVTERRVQLSDNLLVDIVARNCETPDQRTEITRQVCRSMTDGRGKNTSDTARRSIVDSKTDSFQFFPGYIYRFDKEENIVVAILVATDAQKTGCLSSILEYHRPMLSIEQVSEINRKTAQIRESLLTRFNRPVGNRGYELLITDPGLRNFGYQSLTFNLQPDHQSISIKLKINGTIYQYILDSSYRMLPAKDVKRFINPQDQAWLELLTLTHLKKLICTEEENLPTEMLVPEKQHSIYKGQMFGRVEHLRRLPPGHKFSQEAFLHCLDSHLPIKSLLVINKMRVDINWGGTLESGMWTYVRSVGKPTDTKHAHPVRIAFTNAADTIREVIPLGVVSDEELARIEREILRELESPI